MPYLYTYTSIDTSAVLTAQVLKKRFFPNGGFDYISASNSEATGMRTAVQDAYISLVEARRSMFTVGNVTSNSRNGGASVWTSYPGPTPPSFHETKTYRVPHSNAPFEKKKRDGKVVVSPYYRGRVTVTSTPGRTYTSYTPHSQSETITLGKWYNEMGFEEISISGASAYIVPGHPELAIRDAVGNIMYGGGNAQWKPAVSVSADIIKDILFSNLPVDTGTATALVAEANEKTFDALTQLAELPETLRSVAVFLQQASSIISGFRRREFSVSQSFRDRKRYLNVRLNEDLETNARRLRDLVAQQAPTVRRERVARERELRALRRHRDRTMRTYDRAMGRLEIEFNDAIASLWLNFRYNIMPTVYALVDLQFALTNNPAFQTYREGTQVNDEVYIFDGFPNAPRKVIERFWIKDKVKNTVGPFSFSYGNFSANLVVTAIELTRLSFVLDWFVNIGDFFSSLTGKGTADRYSSHSYLIESTYHNRDAFGRSISFDAKFYDRQIVDLTSLCGLCFEPELNPKRVLDSFALSWNAIRGNLLRSIR